MCAKKAHKNIKNHSKKTKTHVNSCIYNNVFFMSDIMEIVQVRSEGTFGGYVLLGAEKNYKKQT